MYHVIDIPLSVEYDLNEIHKNYPTWKLISVCTGGRLGYNTIWYEAPEKLINWNKFSIDRPQLGNKILVSQKLGDVWHTVLCEVVEIEQGEKMVIKNTAGETRHLHNEDYWVKVTEPE